MSPQDFAYWLRSLFEFQPDLKTLNEVQVALIKKHLDLVIQNVTEDADLGDYLDVLRGGVVPPPPLPQPPPGGCWPSGYGQSGRRIC